MSELEGCDAFVASAGGGPVGTHFPSRALPAKPMAADDLDDAPRCVRALEISDGKAHFSDTKCCMHGFPCSSGPKTADKMWVPAVMILVRFTVAYIGFDTAGMLKQAKICEVAATFLFVVEEVL